MSTMDYEKSQLPHIWIVVFIVGFIGMVLGITVGIVYYFKSQFRINKVKDAMVKHGNCNN